MIDCVILSYARDKQLYRMTQRAVNSLIADFDSKIYVVETNPNIQPYAGAETIFPRKEFNYNQFLKIGISAGSNPFVFVLNNDIICLKGCQRTLMNWLDTYDSVSPMNPMLAQHKEFKQVANEGFSIWSPGHLAGWAIMMKRELINEVGIDTLFPDQFKFWYQDNVFAEVMIQRGKKHALITSAKLEHLQGKTLSGQEDKEHLTHEQKEVFDNWLASIE